ncbi:hypothetical protein L6452_27963 [Arctium lappa]|uniref:Uncharacterized protein n=1 Tax=Arctium lappa TaxID=4217 RepID=A0ACB8ZY08_ARCLA|nr:hypothetical protein L6452_27963 [Arctium lappa]
MIYCLQLHCTSVVRISFVLPPLSHHPPLPRAPLTDSDHHSSTYHRQRPLPFSFSSPPLSSSYRVDKQR